MKFVIHYQFRHNTCFPNYYSISWNDYAYNRRGQYAWHGPLTRYVQLRVAHAPGMPGNFPCHQLQRKPLVSDSGMHHVTCVMHASWCMSESLTSGGRENIPGIPGAWETHNFTYLVRGPWLMCVRSWIPDATNNCLKNLPLANMNLQGK